MSTITTIASSDLITDSRTVINNNFSNLNTDKEEVSNKSTDTTFAANSDTLYPSQKAVKAYVDTGGNVNASTTAKGIVEEAVDAEVVAGTDTGATGARLFVPPSKLNTQIDAKIAAANIPGKIVVNVTEVAVGTSDAAENTVLTQQIDGGLLSTNNAIRYWIYFSDISVQNTFTCTIRIKYGGTTLHSFSPIPTNVAGRKVTIDGYIMADGSDSAQKTFYKYTDADGTYVGSANGTATESSASNQNFVVTVQFSGSNGNNNATYEDAIIEKIR